ncbi:MAG: Ger(x)C family spore germination protein [Syntrophomonadaceae bacterium]|nr:Ger(x)C family spore germination protein [Syntrophomonadaceae bacterium]
MKKFVVFLLLVIFCISGCGEIELNNAAIPIAFGIDSKDNRIFVSVQIAKPVSPGTSAGNAPQFFVITASGQTFSEASRNISLFFASIPLWSQVQVSLLSDTKAQQGVDDLVDLLVRNRFVRKTNTLVVTKNATPEQILTINPYLESYTGVAIRKLLQSQEKQLGIYIHTDIEEFLQKLSAPGVEPTIPLITIQKNGREKQLLLDGTAVFKDTKMIGSLNETESRGYSLINPKTKTIGLFLIPSPVDPEHKVTLEISYSQTKVTPVINGQNIKMNIEINLDGNFYEQSGTENLFTPEIFKMIENGAEQELKRQMTLSIKKAKSLNSDIFGWGNLVYHKDPEVWKQVEDDWDQLFPEIPYAIKVNFELRRSYLTDKSFIFR